jgi:hypothetical protein
MDSRKDNSPNPNNNKKDNQDNNVNSDSNLDKPIEISFDQLPESANNLSEIHSLSNDTVFSALSSDPELSSAELSADGLSISAEFTTASAPMLPAIGASNFYVKVNNVPMPVTFGTRDSASNTTYIINLPEPIIHNSATGYGVTNITLSYIGGNVRNNSGVGLSNFKNIAVSFASTDFPISYFDPLDWTIGGYSTSVPSGDLFERRSGSVAGIVVYDSGSGGTGGTGGTGTTGGGTGTTVGLTGNIYGQSVLNYNAASGGMQVHYFGCYSTNNDTETSDNILAGTYNIQDILDNNIRSASAFGGAAAPDQTDTFGDGNGYSVINYLTKVSGLYPIVKSIEFCVTASIPKNFVLEAKSSPTSSWQELVYMYASTRTQEYFRYVFTSNSLRLYAVRLRYRGDYYYQDNTGTITVAGKDTITGLKALQISHFPDFSDAATFASTFPAGVNLGDGWIKFTDGIAEYPWDMVNTSSIWTSFAGLGTSGSKVAYFKNSLIAASSAIGNTSYIYNINSSGVGTTIYSVASTINDFIVHDNRLYAALESGKVIRTTTGTTFTDAITGLAPVKALLSFGNRLWVGTGLSGTAYPDGKVYSFNASTSALSLSRTFAQSGVQAFGKSTKYLFAGLSGSSSGQVYNTDGNVWSQTLDSLEDRIDTIEYNSGKNQLWVGDSSGAVYSVSFNNDGTINTTSRIYDQQADRYYDFTSGADSDIFWMISSNSTNGIVSYVTELDAFKYVNQPASTTIRQMTYWGSSAYGIALNGQIYRADSSSLKTNNRKVYVRFKNNANNISNTSVIDNIIFGTASVGNSSQEPAGKIHQITPGVSPSGSSVVTYTTTNSPVSALYAPTRKTRQTGIYESEPYYVATLTRWDEVTTVANYPAGASGGPGLEAGVKIDIYIRTANTRTELLEKDWGSAFTYSTIDGDTSGTITNTYSLAAYGGQWIQYKAVLSTATEAVTPYIDSVSIYYYASEATYFYTKLFDTTSQLDSSPAPLIRRGLLTYNGMENGGIIEFKYNTDPDESSAFQLSNYTSLTPNSVFTLDTPSQYIRFAALLVSVDADPAVIDDIGIQLETATDDLYWMKPESLSGLSLTSTTVSGGSPTTCAVTIVGPAPTGGTVITLSSDDVHASVPSTVTITSGNSRVTFTVTTTSVVEETIANITATLGDGAISVSLTIT